MQLDNIESRIVRYGQLQPCKTAFIDAHTPGSNKKENFTIIGQGVSESPDQHVHINIPHGFNIGAAGQPPKCRNSLHSHKTAEVFFILSGRWRFFWGRNGDAGEVILQEGDIINIPTGLFRGFENIGSDYGMIMSILGGDDAGGGVEWAPQVIDDASQHGLVLGEDGRLYDTKKGQYLPNGIVPMPKLTEEQLKRYSEPEASQVIPNYVARYYDMYGISNKTRSLVIGELGVLRDKPGFEVFFMTDKISDEPLYQADKPTVLMPMKGYWRVKLSACTITLSPGDTFSVPVGESYQISPSMSGESSLFQIIKTDDSAGPTWVPAA